MEDKIEELAYEAMKELSPVQYEKTVNSLQTIIDKLTLLIHENQNDVNTERMAPQEIVEIAFRIYENKIDNKLEDSLSMLDEMENRYEQVVQKAYDDAMQQNQANSE